MQDALPEREFQIWAKKRMVDIDHPQAWKKRVGLFDNGGAIQIMIRSNKEPKTSKRNQSKSQQRQKIMNTNNSQNPEHNASVLTIY
jgi:hypothetical protein